MKFKLVPIHSVKQVPYIGKVYDLSIKKNHSYNVFNIIVHNSMCHTRLNTGVGVPQLYALKQISDVLDGENFSNKKIIADGGMSDVSDMAKALIYADAVMLGYYLAACSETPGRAFERGDGQYYKMYGGSTSGEHKDSQGQKIRFVEGAMQEVPFRGKVDYRLRKIKEGLQSSLSYVGASNLKEFRTNVELIEISSGSKIESKF